MKKLNGLCTAIIVILQLETVISSSGGGGGASIDSISVELAKDVISMPSPSAWPERFHALLYMNLSSSSRLQISDLWYDWPRGRNVNIIQKQLGMLLYDVEWNNGTSFYYTLGNKSTCQIMNFEVGIPRPDFLDGANYLGTQLTDGFLCNVWEKVDFIWYYEDVLTKLPVRWDFYDGISTHVITFEVGAVLQDYVTQAPAYCFKQHHTRKPTTLEAQVLSQNRLRFS